MAYRYFCLLASYRTQISFSFDALAAAQKAYENLAKRAALLGAVAASPEDKAAAEAWKRRMLEMVQNDLNTAGAIAVLQECLKDKTLPSGAKAEAIKFADSLLGLELEATAAELNSSSDKAPMDDGLGGKLRNLADARAKAKSNKDYALADALRAEIESLGYIVEDAKDGVKIIKKK
jgi:cysteinyl-tRNA synthetase